jgi:hypothetical protein
MTHGNYGHLDDFALEQYSMGDLPESETGVFEEHLLVCEPCRLRLQQTDEYIASMRGAGVEFRSRQRLAPVEGQRRRWTWLRLVPAVGAVAALVAVIGWWSGSPDMAGPPFAISLEATRGAANSAWAPADTGLLELVDDKGAAQWQGTVTAHDARAEARIPQTKAGTYFIRVYSLSGELLREFGLRTRHR